jgi:hypothetical protein
MYDHEIEFDVVPMTKQELAQMYAPDLTPHAAVNRLMRWVNLHPVLKTELRNTGYQKTSRLLTSRQVRLIVEYLGEP